MIDMTHCLTDVAVLVADEVSPFELGVACEVFGTDRTEQGLPRPDFAVCSATPGPVRSQAGFDIDVPYGLDRLRTADLVIVPNWSRLTVPPVPEVTAALHEAAARGAWLAGFCTGVFALAHAGLLDGRRATTHWLHAEQFAEMFPDVRLDPSVLYVCDDPLYTSAGTSAAVDLCLDLVRHSQGPEVANTIARRMVVPPHRDGGQAQYVQIPVPGSADSLTGVLAWMEEHVVEDLTVEDLARRALMSPRTFARRFRAETGTTPHHWLVTQRVLLAQGLLETSDHDVETVARLSGFGTAAVLRHHFTRKVGTSPLAYRRTFRTAASA